MFFESTPPPFLQLTNSLFQSHLWSSGFYVSWKAAGIFGRTQPFLLYVFLSSHSCSLSVSLATAEWNLSSLTNHKIKIARQSEVSGMLLLLYGFSVQKNALMLFQGTPAWPWDTNPPGSEMKWNRGFGREGYLKIKRSNISPKCSP